MKKPKFIIAEIDEDLKQRFDSKVREEGSKNSRVLRRLIRAYITNETDQNKKGASD